MIFLRKPPPETLRKILDSQAGLNFTYPNVGATIEGTDLPSGFVVDHTRALLGTGTETFEAAKSALRKWRQYAFPWLEAWPDDTPLEKGRDIATVAHVMGLWWVNICRIVEAFDEPNRFGYIYGTLPEHAECGEERFLIELSETGEVTYDILAFSRPYQWMPRLGYPLVRRVQKRFGRDSVESLRREVQTQRRDKERLSTNSG
ncbi:MAG: DUF1990 domain-containing protein [Planctomycetaceae bacterium]|nr:DUF1990 domain-containing protein [Planctomycetaceae bacterium]